MIYTNWTERGYARQREMADVLDSMLCREDFEEEIEYWDEISYSDDAEYAAESLYERYARALELKNGEELRDLYAEAQDGEPEAVERYKKIMDRLPEKEELLKQLMEVLHQMFAQYPTTADLSQRILLGIQQAREEQKKQGVSEIFLSGAGSIQSEDTLRVKILKGFVENLEAPDGLRKGLRGELPESAKTAYDAESDDRVKRRLLADHIRDDVFRHLSSSLEPEALVRLCCRCLEKIVEKICAYTQKSLPLASGNTEQCRELLFDLDVQGMRFLLADQVLESAGIDNMRRNGRNVVRQALDTWKEENTGKEVCSSWVKEAVCACENMADYLDLLKPLEKTAKNLWGKSGASEKSRGEARELWTNLPGKAGEKLPETSEEFRIQLTGLGKKLRREMIDSLKAILCRSGDDPMGESLLRQMIAGIDGRTATIDEDMGDLYRMVPVRNDILGKLETWEEKKGISADENVILQRSVALAGDIDAETAEQIWEIADCLLSVFMHLERYCPYLSAFKKQDDRKYEFTKKRSEKERSQTDSWRWLKIADELSRGVVETNQQTREFLYQFAIAFGMRVYPKDQDKESSGYDKRLDVEEKLFFEYYQDNLYRYLRDEPNGRESEPSGEGINYKNHREIIYLYYLMHEKYTAREKWNRAQKMIDQVEKLVRNEETGRKVTESVRQLREEADEAGRQNTLSRKNWFLLNIKSMTESELSDWVLSHCAVRREIGNHVVPGIAVDQMAKTGMDYLQEVRNTLIERMYNKDDMRINEVTTPLWEAGVYDARKETEMKRKTIRYQRQAAELRMQLRLIDRLKNYYKESDPDFVRVIERVDKILRIPFEEVYTEVWRSADEDSDKKDIREENRTLTRNRLLAYIAQECMLDFGDEFAGWEISSVMDYFCDEYADSAMEDSRFQTISVKNLFDMYLIAALYYEYRFDRVKKSREMDQMVERMNEEVRQILAARE